jgi:hypothetical protein
MFALRTLRELKLLKYFAEAGVSENVSASPIGSAIVEQRKLLILRSSRYSTLSSPHRTNHSMKSTSSKSFSRPIYIESSGHKISVTTTVNTSFIKHVEHSRPCTLQRVSRHQIQLQTDRADDSHSPRSETIKLAAQCQLRSQGLRLWSREEYADGVPW